MTRDNEKEQLAASLRATMAELVAARKPDPEIAGVKAALRAWQNRRFATTYADLAREDRYRPAVEFFLRDLYGGADMSARDADVARVLPLMLKALPAAALLTIRDALAFEALSETMDADVARRLAGRPIDESSYAEAFRAAGGRDQRMQQIRCVAEIGEALDALTRWPMVSTTLKLMRGPARAAGLATLQHFLEDGYSAFRQMRGAGEFLATIVRRETAVVERLFAGHPRPFEVDPA
jgi:hypothetical protein